MIKVQKQTSIYIPKPCSEDWNQMTPTQQGKFCSACHKQVVDFSHMSDNQILNFLSRQSGKLCGRFDATQLQRQLAETKIKKQKSWWMALTMPLLFLFDRSEAQKAQVEQDTTYSMSNNKTNGGLLQNKKSAGETDYNITLGMIAINQSKQITIKGKVVDEYNNAVPFATINEKGKKNAVAADIFGRYSIVINKNSAEVVLATSAIGFENTETRIDVKEDSAIIIMKKDTHDLGDVVVIAGRISTCNRVKKTDTFYSITKKLFGTSMFKVYPNPVANNSIINLQITNAGSYEIQLFNNQSQLVQVEEMTAEIKNTTTQIQLQSNLIAGVYYLRLINQQTKKQYTEKLIIQ